MVEVIVFTSSGFGLFVIVHGFVKFVKLLEDSTFIYIGTRELLQFLVVLLVVVDRAIDVAVALDVVVADVAGLREQQGIVAWSACW